VHTYLWGLDVHDVLVFVPQQVTMSLADQFEVDCVLGIVDVPRHGGLYSAKGDLKLLADLSGSTVLP